MLTSGMDYVTDGTRTGHRSLVSDECMVSQVYMMVIMQTSSTETRQRRTQNEAETLVGQTHRETFSQMCVAQNK